MKAKPLPPQHALLMAFNYDPISGSLSWRYRVDRSAAWNTRYAGRAAGSRMASGYLLVSLDGQFYLVHRIIFKMRTGLEPPSIDHENLQKDDNRWLNLRAAAHAENMCNRPRRKNKQLPKGIDLLPGGRYRARLRTNKQSVHLGCFDTIEAAQDAYAIRAKQIRKNFARID